MYYSYAYVRFPQTLYNGILEINWNRKTQEKINFIFQTNVGFTRAIILFSK